MKKHNKKTVTEDVPITAPEKAKKSPKKIVLFILLELLIVALTALIVYFSLQALTGRPFTDYFIPREPSPEEPFFTAEVINEGTDEETLSVEFSTQFHKTVRVKQENKDGVVTLTPYLVAHKYNGSNENDVLGEVPLKDVKRVDAFNCIIWEKDRLISKNIYDMYNYAQSNGSFGSDQPFSLAFSSVFSESFSARFDEDNIKNGRINILFRTTMYPSDIPYITQNMYALLIACDNIDEIYWEDPAGLHRLVTENEIMQKMPEIIRFYNEQTGEEQRPKKSLKEYTETVYDFQVFYDMVDLYFR